jgi:hypothetical protein
MKPLAAVRHLRSPASLTAERDRFAGSVVGGGLALTIDPGQRITLHELTPGASRRIGSFSSAADAWRAIDEIDLDDQLEPAA